MDMQNEHENLEAPPRLVAALSELPRESVFVPPTVDATLMKAARQHLGGPEKKRIGWFRLIPWSVATAGLAVVVFLAYPHAKEKILAPGRSKVSRSTKSVQGWENASETGIQPQTHGAYVREDLNGDGKVDILDAFMLAKKLQGTPSSDRRLDVNGDG